MHMSVTGARQDIEASACVCLCVTVIVAITATVTDVRKVRPTVCLCVFRKRTECQTRIRCGSPTHIDARNP